MIVILAFFECSLNFAYPGEGFDSPYFYSFSPCYGLAILIQISIPTKQGSGRLCNMLCSGGVCFLHHGWALNKHHLIVLPLWLPREPHSAAKMETYGISETRDQLFTSMGGSKNDDMPPVLLWRHENQMQMQVMISLELAQSKAWVCSAVRIVSAWIESGYIVCNPDLTMDLGKK